MSGRLVTLALFFSFLFVFFLSFVHFYVFCMQPDFKPPFLVFMYSCRLVVLVMRVCVCVLKLNEDCRSILTRGIYIL